MNISKILSISTILARIHNSIAYAQDFFYDAGQQAIQQNQSTEDLGEFFGEQATNQWSLLTELIKTFQLNPFINGGQAPEGAVNYIAFIVNLALSLAAFIAFAFLIYGFYLMFFSKQEEGFDKAKKILISTTIALLLIGLSWFIIAFIFSLFNILR